MAVNEGAIRFWNNLDTPYLLLAFEVLISNNLSVIPLILIILIIESRLASKIDMFWPKLQICIKLGYGIIILGLFTSFKALVTRDTCNLNSSIY